MASAAPRETEEVVATKGAALLESRRLFYAEYGATSRRTEPTSQEDYHHLKEKGQLGDMQLKVLDVLRSGRRWVWSNREIAARLGVDVCHVTGRVYELRQMGLVEYVGRKTCSVKSRRVKAWKLTPRIILGGR